ncbi:MAG TPA: QueT transporter family protein [Coriobacteriia bacterium]
MLRTRYIAQAGVIAAVYGGLTWLMLAFGGVFAWGPIQFRLSEAATVLAVFTPAAIPGLALGSVLANLLNPQAVWPFSALDVVLGSLGTLLGAMWTWRFRSRTWLALLGPIVTNALIVAAYLPIVLKGVGVPMTPVLGISLTGAWLPLYGVLVITIGIGQAVVVYGLGLPLLIALRRTGIAGLLGR